MPKINQRIERFVADVPGTGVVEMFVIHRVGKTGISVFVRTRKPGQQGVIGCRNVFLPANTAQAQKKFEERVNEALKLGFERKVVSGGPAATKFNTMPAPNAVPDGLPSKGSKSQDLANSLRKATGATKVTVRDDRHGTAVAGPKVVTRAVAR